MPGFPDYFFAVDRNALVLSVSYFLSAEANVKCIIKLLADLRAAGAQQLAVKKDCTRNMARGCAHALACFPEAMNPAAAIIERPPATRRFCFPLISEPSSASGGRVACTSMTCGNRKRLIEMAGNWLSGRACLLYWRQRRTLRLSPGLQASYQPEGNGFSSISCLSFTLI